MGTEWSINSDIYDIVDSVKKLQQRYIEDEDETTLSLGVFGFISDTVQPMQKEPFIRLVLWAIPSQLLTSAMPRVMSLAISTELVSWPIWMASLQQQQIVSP